MERHKLLIVDDDLLLQEQLAWALKNDFDLASATIETRRGNLPLRSGPTSFFSTCIFRPQTRLRTGYRTSTRSGALIPRQ